MFRRENYIPVGRQLPRTPPPPDCVQRLSFSEVPIEEHKDSNCTLDYGTPPIRQGCLDEPESMVKGMKDYQLTSADLEFMQKLKKEKELKRLQDEVVMFENEVKSQTMALELTLATIERAEAALKQLPSIVDIRKGALVVLEKSVPSSTDLSNLDIRALLALVTRENIMKAASEKTLELTKLENMVAQRKRKEAKDRGLQEKLIATEQSKIFELMGTLTELKSSLDQQLEVNKSLAAAQKKKGKGATTGETREAGSRSRKKQEDQGIGLRRSKRIANQK